MLSSHHRIFLSLEIFIAAAIFFLSLWDRSYPFHIECCTPYSWYEIQSKPQFWSYMWQPSIASKVWFILSSSKHKKHINHFCYLKIFLFSFAWPPSSTLSPWQPLIRFISLCFRVFSRILLKWTKYVTFYLLSLFKIYLFCYMYQKMYCFVSC